MIPPQTPQTPAAPTPPHTLAELIKAKYPGSYDSVDDVELEKAVRAKYPGVYDQVPSSQPKASAQAQPSNLQLAANMFARSQGIPQAVVQIPSGKELLNTGVNTGVQAGKAFVQPVAHPLDFLSDIVKLPGNVIQSHMDQGQKAWDAIKRGDVSEGVLRELAAIIPVVGPLVANYVDSDQAGKEQIAGNVIGGLSSGKALTSLPSPSRIGTGLQTSAENTVARAMGPTGMEARATALESAPGMLERGVKGSRPQMLAQAQTALKTIGSQMDAEIAKSTQAGQTVPQAGLRAHIQRSLDPLFTTDAKGTRVPIAGLETRIEQLQKLDTFVSELPANIPAEQAKALKTVYGKIADEAGMYGLQASEVDKAKGWAASQLQSALRRGLSSNKTLAQLDADYGFWKGVEGVLEPAVIKGKTSGSPSIASRTGSAMVAASAAGGSAGYALMGPAGLGIGSVVGPSIVKLIESPVWQTSVSAPMKAALADAIASGNASRIAGITRAVVASLPANVRPLFIGYTGAASGAANRGVVGNTGRMGGPGGRQ